MFQPKKPFKFIIIAAKLRSCNSLHFFSQFILSGSITSPEDFKKFIEKDEDGPHCGICRQFYNRSVTNVRNHIESKHFPNSFLYSCPNCSINVNTKVALDRHATRCKSADK